MPIDDTVILVLAGVVGSMIGSFLNVVIHRLPDRKSVVSPGSHCPSCETPIAWYDNLPVLSWLLLRGRCRHCGTGISPRYLGVELLTAGLTVLVAMLYLTGPEGRRFGLFFAVALLTWALIPVTFIDLKLRIIPDRITKPGMVLAPILSLLVPELHRQSPMIDAFSRLQDKPQVVALLTSLAGMAMGAFAIWFMGFLGRLLFKKEAMGLGDLKLMAMIGGFVGPMGVLMAILLGCVLGSVFGLIGYIFTRSHYIPFGPFLSGGTLLVLFARPELVHFFTVTYPSLFVG
jgi:leader peptidase (prepilin peptidase) / N-methyltransferase